MAGKGPDPAALLSVYLQYDRLTDAADLVLSHLTAYQKVCYVIVYSSFLWLPCWLQLFLQFCQHLCCTSLLLLMMSCHNGHKGQHQCGTKIVKQGKS